MPPRGRAFVGHPKKEGLMERMSEKAVETPAIRRRPSLRPLGLVAFSGAIVWATSIAAGTVRAIKVKPEVRTIKVTGSAKKRIVSDLIEWDAAIESHAPDRIAAYKQLREGREKAVA